MDIETKKTLWLLLGSNQYLTGLVYGLMFRRISRGDNSLKASSDRLEELGIELGTSGYKAISLSTKSHQLLVLFLLDLILYVPSAIFQLNRDGSSWVEPVLC